ncbi:MAG: adenosine kinase [Bacteroidales bacterium]|jgi:sugar/nucleoside kinase (ribokinase family)|nr:adenosine kinase [Bacteroidales bacterium]
MKRIIGIGNALVDELIRLESDDFLTEHHLPKGSMQLIDFEFAQKLSQYTSGLESKMCSGGSAANTICGLALLGIKTAFIGKIGNDRYGEAFLADLEACGVTPFLVKSDSMSGFCTSLISPDGERTMATFLGAAATLEPSDIDENALQIGDILYLEGYLLHNHKLIEKAVSIARQKGLIIALDLASYNIVEENLDFLQILVSECADIVFANEAEALAFVGAAPEEAVDRIAQMCPVAIVKAGAEGSWIKTGDQKQFINAFTAQAIDTTGAGDLYAAGFLYGYLNGLDIRSCGRIASRMAAKIVEVIGAKYPQSDYAALKEWISHLYY